MPSLTIVIRVLSTLNPEYSKVFSKFQNPFVFPKVSSLLALNKINVKFRSVNILSHTVIRLLNCYGCHRHLNQSFHRNNWTREIFLRDSFKHRTFKIREDSNCYCDLWLIWRLSHDLYNLPWCRKAFHWTSKSFVLTDWRCPEKQMTIQEFIFCFSFLLHLNELLLQFFKHLVCRCHRKSLRSAGWIYLGCDWSA